MALSIESAFLFVPAFVDWAAAMTGTVFSLDWLGGGLKMPWVALGLLCLASFLIRRLSDEGGPLYLAAGSRLCASCFG